MTTIANAPWIQALGWALIQFLWQGTVIWAAFAVIRALTRRRLGAHARYALACGALGAMTLTPLWTFPRATARRTTRTGFDALVADAVAKRGAVVRRRVDVQRRSFLLAPG